jgi:hypothetical protein
LAELETSPFGVLSAFTSSRWSATREPAMFTWVPRVRLPFAVAVTPAPRPLALPFA